MKRFRVVANGMMQKVQVLGPEAEWVDLYRSEHKAYRMGRRAILRLCVKLKTRGYEQEA